MKCVKNEDDYNGQKYVVDELCAIAKDHEMHIHLIHHIKKLANEEQAAAVAQKFYRVTKGGEVRLPGQRYVLQKGKPIGSNLYPIAELLNQGIELTEITAKEAGW